MKKTLFTFILGSILFTACKKEEVTKIDEHQLEEVPLEEKKQFEHNLEWTAYKTPDKIGVSGTFDSIELQNTNQEAPNAMEYLSGATFTIDTQTVNTKDSLRDGKLVEGFFRLMAGDIKGKFVEIDPNKALVELTMNGVTQKVTFQTSTTETELILTGTIDIINDFEATTAFNSLHELCKDLHLDKTWTEVDLKVTISKN